MSNNKYGTSPVGSPAMRKRPTKARTELLQTFFDFLELEPTTGEMEMIDQIISTMMWSQRGYETVFHAACTAHRCVHQEVPPWELRKKKKP